MTALARGATGGDEKPRLLARLNPAKTEKGGRVGDVADKLLSKVGTGGKLASMVSAGSRIVERMRDQGGSGSEVGQERGREAPAAATNGSGGDLPIPLQEAIDIAVPIEVVYALFTRFEDYPEFIDRIYAAEHVDETHAAFEARVHGRQQHIEVEIRDARENERVDWRASEGIPHGGVVSFHRLAPRLTHVEVSVDLESEGLLQRLMRKVHLSERAVRADLHRFKAYAELSEEGLGLEEELAEEDFEDEDLGAEDVEQGEWDEEDLDEDDEHATQEGRT